MGTRSCSLLVVIATASTMGVMSHAQSRSLQLNVCHAGSLQAAFTQVEEAFRKQHPDVDVIDTSGGSVDLARQFAAGTLPCDVYAPADHLLIDLLLKPAGLADYSIVFARGRIVLAYVATDPAAEGLSLVGTFDPPSSVPRVSGNLLRVLSAPGVRIAGAHPFLDPGGYRAHMVFELAQAYLRVPGLYNALLRHYQVIPADGPSIAPPPVLGKDFNFQLMYEHTAAAVASHDPSFRFAELGLEMDLSSVKEGQYSASSVTIPGLGIPASSPSVTIPATRVEWGVTIPTHSRNTAAAISFVGTLLGPVGQAAMRAYGPMPTVPARVSPQDFRRLPDALRSGTAVK